MKPKKDIANFFSTLFDKPDFLQIACHIWPYTSHPWRYPAFVLTTGREKELSFFFTILVIRKPSTSQIEEIEYVKVSVNFL